MSRQVEGTCVGIDELVDFYSNKLSSGRDRQIREHLASCDTCLEMARDYCRFANVPAVEDTPVSRWWSPAVKIAAGIVLVAGIGIIWVANRQPDATALRSVTADPAVEALSPRGNLNEGPREVSWKPVAGADHYVVEFRDVRLNVVWTAENVKNTRLELPQSVTKLLVQGNEYAWRVTAVKPDGARTVSPFVTFSIRR